MGGQTTGFIWTPTKRRGPIAAEFSTPGPASIQLPSTFGVSDAGKGTNVVVKARAPAFTIAGRHEPKVDKAGPGPGQYNITGLSNKAGKDEPSAPSMHIRPKDPKPFVTPAPGDYCPEKSKKVLDPSPKFSFGVKTEMHRDKEMPAPNSYSIPSLLGSSKSSGNHQTAPSFTIAGRGREEDDKMKVPGPGTYNEAEVDKYKTLKSPAFSMGQRTAIPSDHSAKPGPGAHSPEKCMVDKGPAFTMAGKPQDYDRRPTPGPAAYDACILDSYMEKSPVYTISPRTELPTDKTHTPSPNTYSVEKCLRADGPKFTMGCKLKDPQSMDVPGPGTYDDCRLESYLERMPAFSIQSRTDIPTDKGPKPAPNTYRPEKYVAEEGPKFTFGERIEMVPKFLVPGPGAYEISSPDAYLERNPSYSISYRTEFPSDKTVKPSPNTYHINSAYQAMKRENPRFSFGLKHSIYLGHLREQ